MNVWEVRCDELDWRGRDDQFPFRNEESWSLTCIPVINELYSNRQISLQNSAPRGDSMASERFKQMRFLFACAFFE